MFEGITIPTGSGVNHNELLDSLEKQYEIKNEDEKKEKERWQPKEWTLEYEKVVMMSLMGLKGTEIATTMGYTPQHVYNILGTDEAIAIERALIGKVRRDSINITDELKKIQELTVRRLRQSLEVDEIFKESRLGFISRGIEVMKGTGEYLKNAPTNQVNNQFILPASVADRFLEGLEKSDEARRLLVESSKIEDAVVVESNDE